MQYPIFDYSVVTVGKKQHFLSFHIVTVLISILFRTRKAFVDNCVTYNKSFDSRSNISFLKKIFSHILYYCTHSSYSITYCFFLLIMLRQRTPDLQFLLFKRKSNSSQNTRTAVMLWENNQLNIFIDWISVVIQLHLNNKKKTMDLSGALVYQK